MRQKQNAPAKGATRDFGKNLYDTVIFLIILLGVLWRFNF
jgi:hypothetical protein